MKPTDVMPVQKWKELEKEFAARSGLTAVAFDAGNGRLTDATIWANELCPVIKGNPDSANQICSVAQQNMAAICKKTGRPVLEECDAGMFKLLVPIIVDGEFAGTMGGCGRLLVDGELEVDYIAEATGKPPEEIERLGSSVVTLSQEDAEALVQFLTERIGKNLIDGNDRQGD
jgi:ligand-binding sensor protein